MPAEHFPSENQSTSPGESAHDSVPTYEQSTDQSDTTGSFIRDGGVLLAESLSRITAGEHGPKEIQSYLTDLLADTEGKVPTAERAAAFTLLAERQKQQGRENAITAGATMSLEVVDSVKTTRRGIGQFAGMVLQNIDHFAQQADRGGAAHDVAGSIEKGLDGLNELRHNWAQRQKSIGETFSSTLQATLSAEAALQTASESLTPDYKGQPVDLSELINDSIKNDLAEQFYQAIARGESITDIIASELSSPQDDKGLKRIQFYAEFSERHSALVRKIENDTELGADHERAALLQFRRQGSVQAIRNMQVFVRNVKDVPLKLNSAFGSTEGLTKWLASKLESLNQNTPTETLIEDVITTPENAVETPTEIIQSAPAPQERPAQPDYASAKGMKETINPAAEQRAAVQPSSVVQDFVRSQSTPAEPAPSPYSEGYVQSSPRQQTPHIVRRPSQTPPAPASGPRISRITEQFAEQPQQEHRFSAPSARTHEGTTDAINKPRPAHPNAFPKPDVSKKETPQWIRTIDGLKKPKDQR